MTEPRAKGVKDPLPGDIKNRLKGMAEQIGPPDEPGKDKTHDRAVQLMDGAVRYLLEVEDERASAQGVSYPGRPEDVVRFRVNESLKAHRATELKPTVPDVPEVPTPPAPGEPSQPAPK